VDGGVKAVLEWFGVAPFEISSARSCAATWELGDRPPVCDSRSGAGYSRPGWPAQTTSHVRCARPRECGVSGSPHARGVEVAAWDA